MEMNFYGVFLLNIRIVGETLDFSLLILYLMLDFVCSFIISLDIRNI